MKVKHLGDDNASHINCFDLIGEKRVKKDNNNNNDDENMVKFTPEAKLFITISYFHQFYSFDAKLFDVIE